MSKFVKTQYGTPKEILKFPKHFIAVTVTVDDTDIPVNEEGKKIVPAGTIVGGGTLEDPTVHVVKTNDELTGADAEGVLLYDVDVTYGPKEAAMVIHGFINLDKLPEEPHESAIEALKQITFLR